MKSLSLYPIKYLHDFFVLHGSFLETYILLASTSSISNNFLFYISCDIDLIVILLYASKIYSGVYRILDKLISDIKTNIVKIFKKRIIENIFKNLHKIFKKAH